MTNFKFRFSVFLIRLLPLNAFGNEVILVASLNRYLNCDGLDYNGKFLR